MKKAMTLTMIALISFFLLSDMAFARGGVFVQNDLPVSGANALDVRFTVDVPYWFDPDAKLSPGESTNLYFDCNVGQNYVVKGKVDKARMRDIDIRIDGVRCGDRVRVFYDDAYRLEKF